MAGLWEAPKDKNEVYVRGAAVALLAFVLTGLFYVAIRRVADFASGRAAPKISRAVRSEYLNDTEPPAVSPSRVGSPMSPGLPAYRPAQYVPPPAPAAAPVFAPPGAPGYSPFAVESQRRVAQETLKPLRDVLTTVRRYDAQALWPTLSSNTTSGGPTTVAGRAIMPRDEIEGEDDGGREATLAAVAEAQRRRQNTERVLGETESLSTELALVAHPDNFPEPLRDGVGEVAREMRIYLAAVQTAATNPEDRDRLKTLATKHLSNSEAALVKVEQLAGGGGTAIH